MQPYTGELRNIDNDDEKFRSLAEGFEPVPEHLNRAACRKLNGKKTAIISLTSGGKLSKHAAYLRKKKKQAAKMVRRANRHQGNK